jgi:hypothetical protein
MADSSTVVCVCLESIRVATWALSCQATGFPVDGTVSDPELWYNAANGADCIPVCKYVMICALPLMTVDRESNEHRNCRLSTDT